MRYIQRWTAEEESLRSRASSESAAMEPRDGKRSSSTSNDNKLVEIEQDVELISPRPRKQLRFDGPPPALLPPPRPARKRSCSIHALLPDGRVLKFQAPVLSSDQQMFIDELRRRDQEQNRRQRQQHVGEVNWAGVWLEDRLGKKIENLRDFILDKEHLLLILQDGRKDPVHRDEELWNVTPEPEMLERLPDGYTLETALADHVDNALQAVWNNDENTRRLVSVDITDDKISIFDTGMGMDASEQNSLAKWGTVGASNSRNLQHHGVGSSPPFLKPYLGRFGVGGVAAALFLGKKVVVSSKTRRSHKVVTLTLEKGEIVKKQFKQQGESSSRVWRTPGKFYEMTEEQKRKSPHGSFTCVEITCLNSARCVTGAQQYWKQEQVRQMLKDIYSLYIQAESSSMRTMTPVEFEVNGENLLEELGGEVATCNKYSCNGEPFVVDLHFKRDVSGSSGSSKANARLTCRYFPSVKGKETFDTVIDELKHANLLTFGAETFESFPRVRVRWLGRLLPASRWSAFPFMQVHGKQETHQKRWLKRVHTFADVDGGFHPRPVKTELDPGHPFTTALQQLGTPLTEVVTAAVVYKGRELSVQQLSFEFSVWLRQMHESYDVEVQFGDDPTFVINQPELERQLKVEKPVVVFHRYLKDPKGDWEAGDRIKLQQGLPNLKSNFYGTIEWFFCDYGEVLGEVRVICRPLALSEKPSKIEKINDNCRFYINSSVHFPVTHLTTGKCQRLNQAQWVMQLERLRNRGPSYLQIFTEEECASFHEKALPDSGKACIAGLCLPDQVLVVVRPLKGQGSSTKQGMICDLGTRIKVELKFQSDSFPELDFVRSCYIQPTTKNSIKGIYSLKLKDVTDELLVKAGKYTFTFLLEDERYLNVKPAVWTTKIEPVNDVKEWIVSGDCNFRLDEPVQQPLAIQRLDPFGNIIIFEELIDIKLSILSLEGLLISEPTIDARNVGLSADRKTIHLKDFVVCGRLFENCKAQLCLYLAGQNIKKDSVVRPGKPCAFFIKYCSVPTRVGNEASSYQIVKPLELGEIIQHLRLQGKDKFGNPTDVGDVTLELDGLEGSKQIDEQGCINLQDLRVTAPYNSGGSVALRLSKEGQFVLRIRFKTCARSLRFNSDHRPQYTYFIGRKIEGLEVELVDDREQLDSSVTGLQFPVQLSWSPTVCCIFEAGRCQLPSIEMPRSPGIWEGRVSATSCNVFLVFQVELVLAEAEKIDCIPGESDEYVAHCGELIRVPFQALDEFRLPGALTQEVIDNLFIKVWPENGFSAMEEVHDEEIVSAKSGGYVKLVLYGQTGFYKLTVFDKRLDGLEVLCWRLNLQPGEPNKLVAMLPGDDLWSKPLRSIQLDNGELFPELLVYVLDSFDNICVNNSEGLKMVLHIVGDCGLKLVEAVRNGYASFGLLPVNMVVGTYNATFAVEDTMLLLNMPLLVKPGNHPSSMELVTDGPLQVVLSDALSQFIPPVEIIVHSADGAPLRQIYQAPLLQILHSDEEERQYSSKPVADGAAKFLFQNVPLPLKAGSYELKFVLDAVHPCFLELKVVHGPARRLKLEVESNTTLITSIVDEHDNICSDFYASVSLKLTEVDSHKTRSMIVDTKHGKALFQLLDFIESGFYSLSVYLANSEEHGLKGIESQPLLVSQPGEVAAQIAKQQEVVTRFKSHLYAADKKLVELRSSMVQLQQRIEHLCEEFERMDARQTLLLKLREENRDLDLLENEKQQPRRSEREIIYELNFLYRQGLKEPLALHRFGTTSCNAELLGHVVMLAQVETEALSKYLSAYVGEENLLAYVCKSENGYRLLDNDAFKAFAAKELELNELKLFQVLVLDRIKPFEGIDEEHPQELLVLPNPVLSSGQQPAGFVGYAVNLLYLPTELLYLRRTLFYKLFKTAQVYDCCENMVAAREQLNCWNGGISMDGTIFWPNSGTTRRVGTTRQPRVRFAIVPFEDRISCLLLSPLAKAFERRRESSELEKMKEESANKMNECKKEVSTSQQEIENMLRRRETIYSRVAEATASLAVMNESLRHAVAEAKQRMSQEQYEGRQLQLFLLPQ